MHEAEAGAEFEHDTLSLGAGLSRPLVALRIATGLLQGVLLYWLYRASQDVAWPATSAFAMVPLVLLGLILPVLLISSLGHLKAKQAAVWLLVALAVLLADGDDGHRRRGPVGARMGEHPPRGLVAAGGLVRQRLPGPAVHHGGVSAWQGVQRGAGAQVVIGPAGKQAALRTLDGDAQRVVLHGGADGVRAPHVVAADLRAQRQVLALLVGEGRVQVGGHRERDGDGVARFLLHVRHRQWIKFAHRYPSDI